MHDGLPLLQVPYSAPEAPKEQKEERAFEPGTA